MWGEGTKNGRGEEGKEGDWRKCAAQLKLKRTTLTCNINSLYMGWRQSWSPYSLEKKTGIQHENDVIDASLWYIFFLFKQFYFIQSEDEYRTPWKIHSKPPGARRCNCYRLVLTGPSFQLPGEGEGKARHTPRSVFLISLLDDSYAVNAEHFPLVHAEFLLL